MKCIDALINSKKMSSWLFYGGWILWIPEDLELAFASTSQRVAKGSRQLGTVFGSGGEALLNYMNTFERIFLHPLLSSYSLTSLGRLWHGSSFKMWHWEKGLPSSASSSKDTPRVAVDGRGFKSSLSNIHYTPSVPENSCTTELDSALSYVGRSLPLI